MTERMKVTVNGTVYSVEIDDPDGLMDKPTEVRVNGRSYTVDLRSTTRPPIRVVSQERPPAGKNKPQPAPRPAHHSAVSDSGQRQSVVAPMPGKILSVAVRVGDRVQPKDVLCTLEAMKMEMTVTAPVAGTVRQVQAHVGENVGSGDLLFLIE